MFWCRSNPPHSNLACRNRDLLMSEKNMSQSDSVQETLRRNRTIVMSLVTSFVFLAITVIFAPGLLSSNTPNYGGFALTIPLIVVGLICAFLAWQNRVTLGAGILLGTILILALGAPIVGQGQGVSE